MASTSETAHAKNVVNFEVLIFFCTSYGATYNPGKASLTLSNLNVLHHQAATILQATKTAKTGFDYAVNERLLAFKDLKPLTTKIINILAASGTSDLVIAVAKNINRKIQGIKAGATTKVAVSNSADTNSARPIAHIPATDKTISNSQQGYDSQLDYFTKLIEVFVKNANYQLTESDHEAEALQTLLEHMKAKNTEVINRYTAWSNVRVQQNNTLYNPVMGLVQTAAEVKKYIKSAFGATSSQFKDVSTIEFKNIKK